MSKKTPLQTGQLHQIVTSLYNSAPGGSWRKLNNALHNCLIAAIEAKVKVGADDFKAIHNDTCGGWWMGNSDGGHLGERYYRVALHHGNTPAAISFEKWAGRPAVLWPERTAKPERLTVGSEFRWEGVDVRVTSISDTKLVACSYVTNPDAPLYREMIEGRISNLDCYRRVHKIVPQANGDQWILVGPQLTGNSDTQVVGRRFNITFDELATARRAADRKVKDAIKLIAATTTVEALTALAERLNDERTTYRHFDIEALRAALTARQAQFDEAHSRDPVKVSAKEVAEIARWKAGERKTAWFNTVALRVSADGQWVETSTGQRDTVESVRRLLPWAMRQRQQVGPVDDKRLAQHTVEEITVAGIKVGCTVVPWAEVEWLHARLIGKSSHGEPPEGTASNANGTATLAEAA